MDSYQLEADRLRKIFREGGETAFQLAVYESWNWPYAHGQLFGYCTSDYNDFIGGVYCGCLTQVKAGRDRAQTEEVTQMIRGDERIPKNYQHITHPDQLAVFVEWQRKLDALWGREVKEEWKGA